MANDPSNRHHHRPRKDVLSCLGLWCPLQRDTPPTYHCQRRTSLHQRNGMPVYELQPQEAIRARMACDCKHVKRQGQNLFIGFNVLLILQRTSISQFRQSLYIISSCRSGTACVRTRPVGRTSESLQSHCFISYHFVL